MGLDVPQELFVPVLDYVTGTAVRAADESGLSQVFLDYTSQLLDRLRGYAPDDLGLEALAAEGGTAATSAIDASQAAAGLSFGRTQALLPFVSDYVAQAAGLSADQLNQLSLEERYAALDTALPNWRQLLLDQPQEALTQFTASVEGYLEGPLQENIAAAQVHGTTLSRLSAQYLTEGATEESLRTTARRYSEAAAAGGVFGQIAGAGQAQAFAETQAQALELGAQLGQQASAFYEQAAQMSASGSQLAAAVQEQAAGEAERLGNILPELANQADLYAGFMNLIAPGVFTTADTAAEVSQSMDRTALDQAGDIAAFNNEMAIAVTTSAMEEVDNMLTAGMSIMLNDANYLYQRHVRNRQRRQEDTQTWISIVSAAIAAYGWYAALVV